MSQVQALKNYLLAKLHVYEYESARFIWISLIFFSLYFVSAVFRNYVDTTFFKRYGVVQMPLMFVINGVISFFIFGVMHRFWSKFRNENLLAGFLTFYFVSLLGIYFLVKADFSISYPLLFQLLYLQDSIFLVYLWNIAGDLFSASQGKRIFHLIMGAQVLGSTLGNFTTKPLIREFGDDFSLIIFAASFLLIAIFLVISSRRYLDQTSANPAVIAVPDRKLREVPAIIKQYPIFRYLFICALIPNILLPILTYQFSLLANSTFGTEQTLISFLGYFRGSMTLAVFLALWLVGKFYARMGISRTSLIAPINFTLIFGALTFYYNIFVAAYGQFTTVIIQRVLNGPVNKILFNLLPQKISQWSRVFLRGAVVKAGMMAGALLLWTLKPLFPPEYLAPLAAVLALYLTVETVIFVRQYYHGLKQVIVEDSDGLNLLEASSTGENYLTHPRMQDLDLVKSQPGEAEINPTPGLTPDIALKLLHDDSPATRAEAAIFFINHPDLRAVGELLRLLDDQETVRKAAIEALAGFGEQITSFLEVGLLNSTWRRQKGILEVLRLAKLKDFDISPYMHHHVRDTYNNLIFIEALSRFPKSQAVDLLKTHLMEKNQEILDVIFHALWVTYDDMRLMYGALHSHQSAIAVEMVEELLNRNLANYLIPLIGEMPITAKISQGRRLMLLVRADDLAGVIAHLVISQDPTTRMLAAFAIGAHTPGMIFYPLAEMLLTDADSMTRETARYALSRCAGKEVAVPNLLEIIHHLQGFDLFAGLSIRELQAIATISGPMSYKTGEVLLREGQDNSVIILIVKGKIKVSRNYGRSNEELAATIGNGTYIGELSLFTQMPANATCVTAEPTEALIIHHRHFQEMMKIYPQIAINFCRYFAARLRGVAY